MAKFRGTVKRSDLEGGYWTLEAEDGAIYKLEGAAAEILKSGLRVEIDGAVDEGAMGIGFGAPVLNTKRHKILLATSEAVADVKQPQPGFETDYIPNT